MNSLIISNISKKYKKHQVLDNINLNIKGIYGLLGPNGAGKTTLMRIIATLVEQNKGTIKYGDVTWENQQHVRSIIGYLPQNFSLYPSVTVLECLNHLAILKGIKDKKERSNLIEALLNDTNLQDVKHKKMKELSGGMTRRVGIVQALIGNPKIIIVDEPTAGLDIEERVRFRNLLQKVGENTIIIISTHIVEDIEHICDYICVLKKGKVLAEGTQQEICKYAEGNVWEIEAEGNTELLDKLKREHQILSTKQDVGNKLILRILSETQPSVSAKQVLPNLEDAYLSIMKGGGLN